MSKKYSLNVYRLDEDVRHNNIVRVFKITEQIGLFIIRVQSVEVKRNKSSIKTHNKN